MLKNRRIVLSAEVVVNDARIATLGAIIDTETGKVQFGHKFTHSEACEEHRDTVREDRNAFEDFVYDLKNDAQAMLGLSNEAPEEETSEGA